MSESISDYTQENDLNKNCGDEDDDLDSFFKKKDKKGKKKKSKKTESGDKQPTKLKKKESESKKDTDNSKDDGTFTKDQEEWIDFEDESQRDYSDLKIQNMQIADEDANANTEIAEYDESGELIPPKPVEGPWKSVPVQKKTTTTQKKKIEPEAPKKTGAYRPPQARGGNANLLPSALPKKNRRQQQMPQINNELDFPSLGQEVVKDPTIPPKGFEMVKHGSKSGTWQTQQQQHAIASEIKLNNQYSALDADE